MISSLNAANSTFLNNLSAIQARLATAENQLSSGLKIVNPSDSPDQISQLLATRASLASVQTINENLVNTTAEVNTAETALSNASDAIQQAQVLGSEGASTTATAATRQTLAGQIGDVITQLVGIANTQANGRYIFGGDSDQSAPYTVDLTQSNPISNYLGSSATRLAQNPDGSTFAVSENAQQIFDSPTTANNVFSSLVALRSALQNNDTTGISSALTTLGTAATYFQGQLAFYGRVQDKVSNATNQGQSLATTLQTQVSNIQDADLTQAILELNQGQTAQQAALQEKAATPATSLFDFLK